MPQRTPHEYDGRVGGVPLRRWLSRLAWLVMLCAVVVSGAPLTELVGGLQGEFEDTSRESEEENIEWDSWATPPSRRRQPSKAPPITRPRRPRGLIEDAGRHYAHARRHGEPAPGLANQLCARLRC